MLGDDFHVGARNRTLSTSIYNSRHAGPSIQHPRVFMSPKLAIFAIFYQNKILQKNRMNARNTSLFTQCNLLRNS